nr:MAG TPA: hypothetical protein [Caudoviricetes sp.]
MIFHHRVSHLLCYRCQVLLRSICFNLPRFSTIFYNLIFFVFSLCFLEKCKVLQGPVP